MTVHPAGLAIAFFILGSVVATIYWMLHPPATAADRAATRTEEDVEAMIGSVIIVFSEEIHSEHMLALAARVARRERAELRAIYVVEVPHTLPVDAEMEKEHRAALDVLATAEAIARKNNVEITTEVVPARQVWQGVLDLARRIDAHLIVLGSYREGRYAEAPLGRNIEMIAAKAPCDVLIGVQGQSGRVLSQTPDGTAVPAQTAVR
ncbi:MAG: universal stress protein [Candidatus Eremiobacteraeota bacterium]|nr:universal stress protein [Candidatus Eremiobacteraeota bacterium]MBV9648008.1 universal stress protein [Candidatus Eremiobacteraeota bacterium]